MTDKLRSIIFPLILIVLSAALIFYKYDEIPKNYAIDEVAFAHLALSLDGKPYTPFSPIADGHATPYFYILLGTLKFFGDNRYGLRLPAAIFGIANVLIFYYLMKKVFRQNEYLPFLLSLIFLTLHWYLNFARFAFEVPFLLFLELTAAYFFLQNSFIPAGIFTGLAFNSYQPGRIFFLLPLLFIFLNRKTRKYLFHFLVPFIIVIAPLTLYLLSNTKSDIRIRQELYLTNTALSPGKKLNYLGENIVKAALMFNVKGDLVGRHNYPGKPALNPFLSLLFIAGLILAIIGRNKLFNQFFLIYFLLSLVPTTLTYPPENPNMLRTFTVIPAVVYFVGVAVTTMYRVILTKRSAWGNPLLIIFTILLFLSSIYELRTYFYYQAQVFPNAFRVRGNLKPALQNFQQFQYNFGKWQIEQPKP